MEIVLQSTNTLDISFTKTLLSDAGINYFVLDEYVSSIEGAIGIFPVRVMVPSKDIEAAKQILVDNNLLGQKL